MKYNRSMIQALTVRCRIKVHPESRQEIDGTLEKFAIACNQILEVAKRENCYNATNLHHLVYRQTRAMTGLKANHVCQAIRRVVSAIKGQKEVHKFRPTSMSLDSRTFVYRESEQSVGITLISKRTWFPLQLGGYQIALLKGQAPTSATLSKHRDGNYYINIEVEINTPTPKGLTPKVIRVNSEVVYR